MIITKAPEAIAILRGTPLRTRTCLISMQCPGRLIATPLNSTCKQAPLHHGSREALERQPELSRAKSQPDLRNSQTAVFEMAGDIPPIPAQYQQSQPGNPPVGLPNGPNPHRQSLLEDYLPAPLLIEPVRSLSHRKRPPIRIACHRIRHQSGRA